MNIKFKIFFLFGKLANENVMLVTIKYLYINFTKIYFLNSYLLNLKMKHVKNVSIILTPV